MPSRVKDVVIVGGPNGAGKTTAAFDLLPESLGIREFVNADEIARGLSPFDPEGVAFAAGRLMLRRIRELLRAQQSFAFETTCASLGHGRLLAEARAAGYRITLLFLWLPSPETAIERVARRIQQGGHRLEPDIIRRRYWAGLRNMRRLYLPLADVVVIYDNSDTGRRVIAERSSDERLLIRSDEHWQKIIEATR